MKSNDPHRDQSVIIQGSPIASARYAFILLHGRGASADDMVSLGWELTDGHTALIAPQAAQHTWYPQSFLAPLAENEPWLSSALGKVAMCVEQCVGAGLHREQIAIIGFSQGACLATEFVARNPHRYGALIAFTGALIGPAGMAQQYSGSLNGTPVLLSSGDPDAHVPWQRVEQAALTLTQMGATVQVVRNVNRPHTILPTEIQAAKELLVASSLSDQPCRRDVLMFGQRASVSTARLQSQMTTRRGCRRDPLRKVFIRRHVPDNEIQRNRLSVIVNDSLRPDPYDRAHAARYNKNIAQ